MFRADAKIELEQELAKAEKARQEGFEGRARVCARRAAGIAVREYLSQSGQAEPGPSAYDLLVHLRELPGVSTRVREAAGLLAMRVSEDFTLPPGTDLIEEARGLARGLEAQLAELDETTMNKTAGNLGGEQDDR